MKNIKMLKYLLGFLIFTSCFFTGCSQQIQTNTPVKTLPLNLQTVTPSAKGTMSTQTLAPRPSLTSTITQTRFPTITPTTLIPLGADQYNEMLQKFLSEGGNCSFPCILGITPGKTTFNEARDIFRWMGNPLSQEKYPDGDAFFSTSLGYQEKDLSITIRLMEDNDIIENMYVGITLPWYKKDTDPHVWQTFLADTILEKYGPPSQVGFKVNFPTEAGYPPKTTWYDMVMEYEQFDLIIEYFQGLTVEDNLIKVCPMLDQYENVSIYLGKDLDDPPYIGVPLEKATFLTIDQFSNLLSQKSELACFEIIKEAFFPTE